MKKIVTKHDFVLKNRVKRKQHLQRLAFVRNMFNDQALKWEYRNASTKASNYAGMSQMRLLSDASPSRNNDYSKPLKVSMSQRFLTPTLPSMLKKSESSRLFKSVKEQRESLMQQCSNAQKELKRERSQILQSENKILTIIQS